MPTAIEFNNISKIYRLGLVSTGTLAHDLKHWWTMNIRGKEDPYLTVGETNDRSTKGESDYVWALKDIDFKVEQGDVVGIIGKNGAGKSTKPTLAEILSIHHFASSKECDSLGYITMGDGFSDTKDYIDIEVNEDSIVAMLRAMTETCEEHGIRFIVVMEPCTNTFNSQTVDSTRLAMIDRIIDSVREKYPMEYHDYLNHTDFRSIELFHSQTHLNHKGAILFAERIKEDCWL